MSRRLLRDAERRKQRRGKSGKDDDGDGPPGSVRVNGRNVLEHARKQRASRDAPGDAGSNAYGQIATGFTQDQANDCAWLRPQRQPNRELPGAVDHAAIRHAGNTKCGKHQAKRGQDAEHEDAEALRRRRLVDEHLERLRLA
jgi:hypothetical protein